MWNGRLPDISYPNFFGTQEFRTHYPEVSNPGPNLDPNLCSNPKL